MQAYRNLTIHPEEAPRSSASTRPRSALLLTNEVSSTTRSASAKPIPPLSPLSRPHLLMSQGIVADRVSSQHLKGMNHLAALQRENRSGEGRIVPDIATVSEDRRQPVLKPPNGFLVHEQTENAPGKTGNRIDAACVLPKP